MRLKKEADEPGVSQSAIPYGSVDSYVVLGDTRSVDPCNLSPNKNNFI